MKKVFYMILAAAFFMAGCQKKEEQSGSIYGVITDKATGEPVRAAGVELYKENNLLTKTVTGNEGQYEFVGIKKGIYSLKVTINEYHDIEYSVSVSSGNTTRADMQLEKIETGLIVYTLEATEIGKDFATLNAQCGYYTGCYPSEIGFYYATHLNPSIGGTKVTAPFDYYPSTKISNLTKATYYFQGYAKNSKGTKYGDVRSFQITGETPPPYIVLESHGIIVQTQDFGTGTNWNTANSICNSSRLGGFADWRLPTINELSVLYQNRNIIGGFQIYSFNSCYWSSTNCGIDHHNSHSFHYGNIYCDGNDDFHDDDYGTHHYNKVRCVRTLP